MKMYSYKLYLTKVEKTVLMTHSSFADGYIHEILALREKCLGNQSRRMLTIMILRNDFYMKAR